MNMGSRRDPNYPTSDTRHASGALRTSGNKYHGQSNAADSGRSGTIRGESFASSPPRELYSNDENYPESDEGNELGEEDMDEEGYSEESEPAAMAEDSGRHVTRGASVSNRSLISEDYLGNGARLGVEMPRGVKRSRGGAAIGQRSSEGGRKSRSKDDSAVPTIAKNMASQLGIAKLTDPDGLILRTESIMGRLYAPENTAEGQEQVDEANIAKAVQDLISFWHTFPDCHVDGADPDYFARLSSENASGLQKASFLAMLLLQLHHPPPVKGKQSFALPHQNKSSHLTDSSQYSSGSLNSTALPKVLIDWMHDNHNSYALVTKKVLTYQPNPTAYVNYWEALLSLTLRGQLSEVIRILKLSDYKHARTASDEGRGESGYHPMQLDNIERVISRAVQLLEHCPALQDGNWNVAGSEWRIFRKYVEQASIDLTNFAEGRDRDIDPLEENFEASNFGIKNPSKRRSQLSREAESLVPWSIYENLKSLYGIMLGGATEITTSANDWIETTIGLTIWWDGDDDDDDFAMGNSTRSRRSLRHSISRGARLVDINNTAAYLRRLASSFEQATGEYDKEMFTINPLEPVEVGLACVFEGNIEGVLGFLRAWSLPIASAVIEIASLGGWYTSAAGSGMMAGFNESDLMVLSINGPPDQGLTRDSVLIEYGEALFDKENLEDSEEQEFKEGWELSLAVLIRLDDTIKANSIVGDLLNRIPLRTDQRVDRILDICQELGMEREAEGIAEVRMCLTVTVEVTKWQQRYADSIAEDSDRYGTALIYYARAHRTKKVKDVLGLLVSLSVVQSVAFPPLSSLDHNLKALISLPKESLGELAELDGEAVAILHTYLTGYATLRNFYDLRDEEVNNPREGQTPSRPILARKKAAVGALLAVINSAADSIHGGLYDEHRESVVQVDGLLALLGEALVFVDRTSPLKPK